MRERQRDYELLFIISPLRSSEEEITATLNRVRQAITTAGGEVIGMNQGPPWGRRKFAYPIREYAEGEASRRPFTEGYYVLCHFRLPSTRVAEVERILKLTDAILRYLLTLIEIPSQLAPVSAATVAVGVSSADEEEDLIDDEEMGDFEEEESEDV